MGPGLIAGVAGNDAGGITTYSVMGATTGLTLLWIFPITIIILAVVQEIAARLGVVTGQGLSDLIRDRFGVRWTAFAMVVLLVANLANTVAEFSGAAAALDIFGISRYITVPLVAVAIWALVLFSSYRTVERVFLAVSLVFVTYIFSAVLAHPDWSQVGHALISPNLTRPVGQRPPADRGGRRYDDHAVHAVLPPERRRRERHRRGRARPGTGRRGRWGRLDQRDRRVHRDRHCPHDLRRRRHDHLGQRRGPGARAGGRQPGRGPVRGRAVRGERAGGDDHADLDLVRDLRGVRLGVGRGQALQRRPGVLRDLHVRAVRGRRWSC